MPIRSGGSYVVVDPKKGTIKQTEAPTKAHKDGPGARDKDGRLIGAVKPEAPSEPAPETKE